MGVMRVRAVRVGIGEISFREGYTPPVSLYAKSSNEAAYGWIGIFRGRQQGICLWLRVSDFL